MTKPLTPRQAQVIDLASLGLNCRQIGEQLGISPRTVEIHRSAAIAALGAVNMVNAAMIHERQRATAAGEPHPPISSGPAAREAPHV